MAAVSGGAGAWYRTVWRWHFYAGLLCIPLVLWLACTGSLYLWKPQIEAMIDRPYDRLQITAPRPPHEQVAAAVRAVPGAIFQAYELPATPRSAARVMVGAGERQVRVYVHPETLAVLKAVDEDSRLMPTLFRLHGELLMGDKGSLVVELGACWAIVMVLTGLYLWWPRGASGAAGLLYPRLRKGKRLFWRDLHAVTGLWVSGFALFLLVSGLPWAAHWGQYLKQVRALTGTAVAAQDWTTGRADALRVRREADAGMRMAAAGHEAHGGMALAAPVKSHADAAPHADLDRLVATVAPLHLAAPVLIAPPAAPGADWTARSDAANRPLRTTLTLDGASGAILSREDFAQRHWIDRAVGYGVAAHEGQLFGLANQLLGTATALGLVLMSLSSAVLWWRRRPDGVLGAPVPQGAPRHRWAVLPALALLAVMLPLLGLSALIVLIVERLVLRRIPAVRDWLGLSPQGFRATMAMPRR
ncbi:MAG: peptidase [Sphingomonas sp. SCN 67-18]|nr:PepSY domain-containing protein [Sphingomonas sp. SCN 67-18]ODU21680.1 MAG: peptidase [Sphingomonas sp. SCN 67-18]